MARNDQAWPQAYHFAAFGQDDFDQAGIFFALLRDRDCARRGRDPIEIDVAPFGLADDLLRDDQHISIARAARSGYGFPQQLGQIVTRLYERDPGEWNDFDRVHDSAL